MIRKSYRENTHFTELASFSFYFQGSSKIKQMTVVHEVDFEDEIVLGIIPVSIHILHDKFRPYFGFDYIFYVFGDITIKTT